MVIYHSMVYCQKGPTRHAYTWQTGPFWQDTLVFNFPTSSLGKHNLFSFYKYQQQLSLRCILFQSVLKTLGALSGLEISSSRWLLQSLDGGAQVYLGHHNHPAYDGYWEVIAQDMSLLVEAWCYV